MPSEFHYPAQHPIKTTVTVLSGQTESDIYDVYGSAKMFNVVPKMIRIPSQAAGSNISFKVGTDDSDLEFLRSNNVVFTIDHSQLGSWESLRADIFASVRKFQIITNIAQVSDIDFEIINYIV